MQGKLRFSRWYVNYEDSEKNKMITELHRLLVTRGSKYTNFIEVEQRLRSSGTIKLYIEGLKDYTSHFASISMTLNLHI